jgi:hypothetical protein
MDILLILYIIAGIKVAYELAIDPSKKNHYLELSSGLDYTKAIFGWPWYVFLYIRDWFKFK